MEKFLLIIREDLKRVSEEERRENIPLMLKWVESIAESGDYLGGEALSAKGRYVRRDDVLSDGPFIESKESVSGVMTILAENIEQATGIAQMCPLVIRGDAAIEVRPFFPIPPGLQGPKWQ